MSRNCSAAFATASSFNRRIRSATLAVLLKYDFIANFPRLWPYSRQNAPLTRKIGYKVVFLSQNHRSSSESCAATGSPVISMVVFDPDIGNQLRGSPLQRFWSCYS